MIKLLKNKVSINVKDMKLMLNYAFSLVIRGLGIVVSFFLIPVYLGYFKEKIILGFWFTLMSVLSWFLSFDLGLGNGLRNKLVPFLVNGKIDETKKLISSAYVSTSIVVVFMTVSVLTVLPFVDINKVFNIDPSIINSHNLKLAILIAFAGMMLNFILKLASSILFALQEAALVGATNLLSNLIVLVGLLVYKPIYDLDKLLFLSFIYLLALNIPQALVSIYVFSKSSTGGYPKMRYFDVSSAISIIKLGLAFFALQLSYLIMNSTNEYLISYLDSPEMVVEYQIYNRVFMLFGSLLLLVAAPLWSAVTHALAEQDYSWIKRKYHQIFKLTTLFFLFMLILFPFIPYFIRLWLGDVTISIDYSTLGLFLVMNILFVWNSMNSAFANGLNNLRPQIISFVIGAVINIPLAILFVSLFKSWSGVVIANIFSLSIYSIVQPIEVIKRFRKEKKYA